MSLIRQRRQGFSKRISRQSRRMCPEHTVTDAPTFYSIVNSICACIVFVGKSFEQSSLSDIVIAAEDTVAGDDPMARVLMAYVVRNHNPGYAQGLNFLAKVFLAITRDEERSFWLLNTFVEDIMIQDFFCRPPSGMNGFAIMMSAFKRIGMDLIPAAKDALGEDTLEFYIELLLARWAIKALVDSVPLDTMLVVWQHLFSNGGGLSHPCISGKFAPFVAVIALIDLAVSTKDGSVTIDDIVNAAAKVTATEMEARLTQLDVKLEAAGGVAAMDAVIEEEKQRLAKKWSSGRRLTEVEHNTHFSEAQLRHLLEHFQGIKNASGCISKLQFVSIVTKVNPKLPHDFVTSTFDVFDGDCSGQADFKELITALSVVLRGTLKERLQLCFEAFDHDHSGFLEQEDIDGVVSCLSKVLPTESLEADSPAASTDLSVAKRVELMDTDGDGVISFVEFYAAASVDENLLQAFGFGRDGTKRVQIGEADAAVDASLVQDERGSGCCTWLFGCCCGGSAAAAAAETPSAI
jgi:Ca2+-binding EF-hand superfamily protein